MTILNLYMVFMAMLALPFSVLFCGYMFHCVRHEYTYDKFGTYLGVICACAAVLFATALAGIIVPAMFPIAMIWVISFIYETDVWKNVKDKLKF